MITHCTGLKRSGISCAGHLSLIKKNIMKIFSPYLSPTMKYAHGSSVFRAHFQSIHRNHDLLGWNLRIGPENSKTKHHLPVIINGKKLNLETIYESSNKVHFFCNSENIILTRQSTRVYSKWKIYETTVKCQRPLERTKNENKQSKGIHENHENWSIFTICFLYDLHLCVDMLFLSPICKYLKMEAKLYFKKAEE